MDKPFNDFYSAWRWLIFHPKMKSRHGSSLFMDYLWIDVVRVNPVTEEIDDNRTKNTATRVWLECCVTEDGSRILDHDLDCGGVTFELAIQQLATEVLEKYGDYRV